MGSRIEIIEGVIITPLKQIEDKRGAVYHVLKNSGNSYYIQSDYAINSNPSVLEYWKGGQNRQYYTNVLEKITVYY